MQIIRRISPMSLDMHIGVQRPFWLAAGLGITSGLLLFVLQVPALSRVDVYPLGCGD